MVFDKYIIRQRINDLTEIHMYFDRTGLELVYYDPFLFSWWEMLLLEYRAVGIPFWHYV